MAPKKSADNKTPAASKKTQEKKKDKPLKPKLKTPTIIKVKIPNTAPKNSSPKPAKLTKKQLAQEKKSQIKLDLANEVATAQLVKAQPIKVEPETEEPKLPQKRGRKKKEVELAATNADSEDAFEPSPVKKKCIRKESTKSAKKKTNTAKGSGVKKRLSLSLSPRKTPVKSTRKTTKDDALTSPEAESKSRKSKLNTESGKQNGSEESLSILHQVNETLLSETANPTIGACPIGSRKTSLNSELSWTKDISSSSTTTCITVCSTDIVRIDKKLPVLKLENIDAQVNKINNHTPSTSESSVSEPMRTERESTPEVDCESLNLSTSSVTPKSLTPLKSHNNENNVSYEIDSTAKALDKLTAKLKNFDLEIINWIGYSNEDIHADDKKLQGKIFQALKEESEVISHCHSLKRVLSNNINVDNTSDVNVQENDLIERNDDIEKANDKDTRKDSAEHVEETTNFRTDDEENKIRYKQYEQNVDDDDALSLFAESLTGIDTGTHNSRSNSMCNADFEEYVPQMVSTDRWEPTKRVSYTPSSINIDKSNEVARAKTVCEKQNADSTSIYKDNEHEKNMTGAVGFNPNTSIQALQNTNTNPTIRAPKLMASYYKPAHGTKSYVLRGTCFFNLLASCKKDKCMFPHIVPDQADISAMLVRLSEELFIQEYMLLRDWPKLRRKYGMCFVEECSRRDLTRILVEMAKDFVMKAKENVWEDAALKVEVIECALLHLNSVDLELCEDLLMYNIHKGVPLCDVFMQAIANTQNFSRFKPVFIKLTKFILSYERTFSLEVANQILERLSILPCERPLLEALLSIVKHTDRRILDNCMVGLFEKQLLVHKDLHEELSELKKLAAVSRPVQSHLFELPGGAQELEPVKSMALPQTEREKRYTSPDTTNLDNMNKTPEEPTTPTEFNRPRLLNIQRTFSNSNSSNEDFRPKTVQKNVPNYKTWRDKSIFNNVMMMRPASPRPHLGRIVHPPTMGFGRNLPNFPRRPGPDYY